MFKKRANEKIVNDIESRADSSINIFDKRSNISVKLDNIKIEEIEEEIEAEIEYFIDDDNTDTITIPMKLNWEMVVTEKETNTGRISVGDEVKIELANDADGNLMVKEIKVFVYYL